MHLNNILEHELDRNSVCKDFLHTVRDGKNYKTKYYNLDAIISVGFKVNSKRAIEFRLWAINVLRQYSVKGYILDKERLKNGTFLNENYFNELLQEAKENIDSNEPTKLLHKMIEDYMYMSSGTYYNWYNEKSELNNLPVISNPEHWTQFEIIDVPILTFSGSKEEDYYLHLDLLKEKAMGCKNFEYKYINDTDHFYNEKELETGNLIYNWIVRMKGD